MSSRFELNEPTVVAETIDDEVMVINLETGTYYNLRAAEALIWDWLMAGATLDEVVDGLDARTTGGHDEIAGAAAAFVADLERERLITAAAGNGAGFDPGAPPAEPSPFTAPQLKPYVDLQTLIQLDPILEMDDDGWPVATEGDGR
jgi:hypothetical protein